MSVGVSSEGEGVHHDVLTQFTGCLHVLYHTQIKFSLKLISNLQKLKCNYWVTGRLWLHSPTEFGGILPPVPSRYTPAERGILKQNTIVKMVDICDIKNRKVSFCNGKSSYIWLVFFLGGGREGNLKGVLTGCWWLGGSHQNCPSHSLKQRS